MDFWKLTCQCPSVHRFYYKNELLYETSEFGKTSSLTHNIDSFVSVKLTSVVVTLWHAHV